MPSRHRKGAGWNNSVLFGLASDGVYQADRVTPIAGALLPHRFTLATHPPKRTVRRSTLCCTFPGLATGRRYRPSCPRKPGLSSSHPKMTSDRPTHSQSPVRMIDSARQYKVQVCGVAAKRVEFAFGPSLALPPSIWIMVVWMISGIAALPWWAASAE